MVPDSYAYKKPASLEAAFRLMEADNTVFLAGGTDLVPLLREEKIEPKIVIDIKSIPELKGIKEVDGELFIGAAELIQDVVEHPLIRPYTALIMGCGVIGCYEIRNRATIGGNICNGSPSADSVPGLLVYDARVILASKAGNRVIPLCDFLLGPGRVGILPGEIMTGVVLPPVNEKEKSWYYRRSRVKGMDLSALSVAMYCEDKSRFRIALGAVWPTVARARQAEEILNGSPFNARQLKAAVDAILADVAPRKGSLRATPEYKKAMIPVMIEKGFTKILGGELA